MRRNNVFQISRFAPLQIIGVFSIEPLVDAVDSIGVAWVKILVGPNNGVAKILVQRGHLAKIFYKNLKSSI